MASVAARTGAHLARLGQAILDVLLPPQCPSCAAIVERTGMLCPPCWQALTFIEQPACRACGVPFGCPADGEALCPHCQRTPPPWDRARSAVVYDDASRRLILAFKNADRTEAAPVFAAWMIRAAGPLLAGEPLLVPVPLHWTRLFVRRYNQAALLAHAIGRARGVEVATDVLIRGKRTRKLGKLGAAGRAAVIEDAIAFRPARRQRLRDRRVVLIDDVLTTGSTAGACCQAVLTAGAAGCDVLTLARTRRP